MTFQKLKLAVKGNVKKLWQIKKVICLFVIMFTIANIFTGFNLISGVLSILFTFSGKIEWAVYAIIAGAFFDFFDGFMARLTKTSGELGKQLDSLADIVTFGVAPGIIVFALLVVSNASEIVNLNGEGISDLWQNDSLSNSVHYWLSIYLHDLVNIRSSIYPPNFHGWRLAVPLFALTIPFFSLFRLAKFNLDTRQATGFIGLPTPANSLFFASFALLLKDGFGLNNWRTEWSMWLIQNQFLLPLILLFSLLLIAEIPLFSLKFSNFKWKENKIRFIFLLLTIVLLISLKVWAIPIVVLLYILSSISNNYFSRTSK